MSARKLSLSGYSAAAGDARRSLPRAASRPARSTSSPRRARASRSPELHVKVGDVVEFKNDDDVSHNVFSVSKIQPFNTKMQTPGAEAAITFTNEGTIEVRCAIHPGMKLLVQVAK